MRYWSLLLAAGFLFSLGVVAYAPLDDDWWLPNYVTTQNGAIDRLESAAADLDAIAHEQAELAGEVRRKAAAGEDGPELIRSYGRRAAGLRTRAEADRAALKELADTRFLPERTGAAATLADEAIGAESRAEQLLQALKIADAPEPLDAATSALNAAAAELASARAEADVSASTMGRAIDHLFVLLLIITGVVFILTEAALVYVMWRYAARPGHKALYSHGSQRLEVIWTLVPAVILIFIAFYQIGTWADIKFRSRVPKGPALAHVTARQFQWETRYPGEDGVVGTADDLFTTNDFHFVKGKPTRIDLKTGDVIHSFFLPQLRVKQDALPGLSIPVWFDADKAGNYELVCAELCGWGHYKMRAKAVAHESQAEFDEWQRNATREQNRDTPAQGVSVAAEEGNRTR